MSDGHSHSSAIIDGGNMVMTGTLVVRTFMRGNSIWAQRRRTIGDTISYLEVYQTKVMQYATEQAIDAN